jgi:Tfp pilus assembly protein PilZ
VIRLENRSQSRISLQDSLNGDSIILHDSSVMNAYLSGEIINISKGGFCISTASPLKRLDVVKVMIPLFDGLPRIPTMAEVRWVKPYGNDENTYNVGMRFIF